MNSISLATHPQKTGADNMSHLIEAQNSLEGEDQDRLIAIVNSSLRVSTEQQFFNWAQCELQYLMPHEVLMCAIWSEVDPNPRFYTFSSNPEFKKEEFSELCQSEDSLLLQMIARARKSGNGCIISQEMTAGDFDQAWVKMLQRYALDNIVAHGLCSSDGQMKSHFYFSGVSEKLSARLLYVLEELLPILDSTLARIVTNKPATTEVTSTETASLGAREIQIINLIKVGKTNQVIADELFISPLTVKNHVQNILKKLNAKTRGHAVARAIDLGLLKTK
jgi:transcriptional regulator EpsA